MGKQGKPIVRDRKSTDGVLYFLDYTYNGVRYRPPLGKNLSVERQSERALEEVNIIHAGRSPKTLSQSGCTFNQFLPTFWQAFSAKGRVDAVRPEGIIRNHLQPRFGKKMLAKINDPVVGKDYIVARLTEAEAGTVGREWQVFMRIINLAVNQDILGKNRLAAVKGNFLPEPAKRERPVHRWELEALRDEGGDEDVWWMAVGAMHTGLRETKLYKEATDVRRHQLEEDGYWVRLDKARTKGKGNPEYFPLNRWAREALSQPLRWKNIAGFREAWEKCCERAKIVDLHFHDLRHLFATALDDLDVEREVVKALMGHKVDDITARYIRKNPRKMREAVTKLEWAYNPTNLSPATVTKASELVNNPISTQEITVTCHAS